MSPAPSPMESSGLWTFEVHELSEGFSAIVYDERGHAVADHLSEEVARLIVKAVNSHEALVEALTECVAAREDWINSTTEEGDRAASERLQKAHAAARVALSKSEGE